VQKKHLLVRAFIDEVFWEDAKIVLPWRKEVITILLDTDLLDWLRQQQISEKDQHYLVHDLLSDG